jgi:hypothetical protein
MAIVDLFSKRERRLRSEVPDVFVYDFISTEFRTQAIHIWNDGFGVDTHGDPFRAIAFRWVHKALCREYGRFVLSAPYLDPEDDVRNFLLGGATAIQALDVIELVFGSLVTLGTRSNFRSYNRPAMTAEEAIEELNARFKEQCLGYQLEGSQIFRIDSTHLHEEVTKPALVLLRSPDFQGAEEEFRKAHEHYLHGRAKEALNEALKAFESTMKVICAKQGWALAGNETAKDLIKICYEKGLVSASLQSHYSGLRSTLEAGIPVLRNRLGGHGQGQQPVVVPDHLVSYALNLTAAAIVFLVKANKALP